MLGCHSDFQTSVKKKFPNRIGTRCVVHHEALMVKTMLDKLLHVLKNVIKTVNFIKANALNSRLFTELCKENNFMFKNLCCIHMLDGFQRGKC